VFEQTRALMAKRSNVFELVDPDHDVVFDGLGESDVMRRENQFIPPVCDGSGQKSSKTVSKSACEAAAGGKSGLKAMKHLI